MSTLLYLFVIFCALLLSRMRLYSDLFLYSVWALITSMYPNLLQMNDCNRLPILIGLAQLFRSWHCTLTVLCTLCCRFKLYVKLFVVMGVTWICEVISWQEGTCEFWWVEPTPGTFRGGGRQMNFNSFAFEICHKFQMFFISSFFIFVITHTMKCPSIILANWKIINSWTFFCGLRSPRYDSHRHCPQCWLWQSPPLSAVLVMTVTVTITAITVVKVVALWPVRGACKSC